MASVGLKDIFVMYLSSFSAENFSCGESKERGECCEVEELNRRGIPRNLEDSCFCRIQEQ